MLALQITNTVSPQQTPNHDVVKVLLYDVIIFTPCLCSSERFNKCAKDRTSYEYVPLQSTKVCLISVSRLRNMLPPLYSTI